MMQLPDDIQSKLDDVAADMAVPPIWVLMACVEIGLSDSDVLVHAVEAVMRQQDNIKKGQMAIARLANVLNITGVVINKRSDVPYFWSENGHIVRELDGVRITGQIIDGEFVPNE